MVSALWNACSDGHLDSVHELLNDASRIDIEIKDHNGVTPLIMAVKNGHVEVVKALLNKGADPTHGLPEQYTSDPAILDLFSRVPGKMAHIDPSTHEIGFTQDHLLDPEKRYYAHQPIPYAYYPGINPSAAPVHDSAMYYPPPPLPTGEQVPGGPPNLPPPEVARLIPCRFYPACRYGASCLFAHPQGPYFSGPLPPPAHYPAPYDPMVAQSFAPNYYPVPPPSFHPPPNAIHPHMTPTSPQPGIHHTPSPMAHARSGSEIVSPQAHFSPSNRPPYATMPPMSPSYSHPGPVPVLSIPPPPLHHQPLPPPPPPPGPQSPPSLYNNTSPTPPFVVRQDGAAPFPPQVTNSHPAYGEVNGGLKSPPLRPQPENFGSGPGTGPNHREGAGNNNRRGNARRVSFGGRKPPCLFYPSGRCKNGDDCRFPHIPSEGSNAPGIFPGKGGSRSRGGHANANGFGTIAEKLESLNLKDDSQPPRATNGIDGSSRSHSTDPGNRGRFTQNHKNHHGVNGNRVDKKAAVKQRVPGDDEFPVLAGSTTPPSRSPGLNGTLTNGIVHSGPTAAQVLQAPAPLRKDSTKESSPRGGTPDPVHPSKGHKHAEPNGIIPHDLPPRRLSS